MPLNPGGTGPQRTTRPPKPSGEAALPACQGAGGGGPGVKYDYAQLMGLWINAGGNPVVAPVAAAIALAESGGCTTALNPVDNGGTQTSWGLWQVSLGNHNAPSSDWNTGIGNAQLAVGKYSAAKGFSPWGTYNSGAYQQFLRTGVTPDTSVIGNISPGSGVSTSSSQDSSQPGTIDVSGPLAAAGAFFHDISVPVAWALEVFEPGQGVRLVAGVGAVAAGAGGIKAWHAAAVNPEGTALPVAIALFGLAAAGAFIAIRPWPQPAGKPVKTWAYVASVVKGQPPAAGPAARPPVGAVEAGLVTLFGLWAASKAAEGIAGAVTAGAGIGAAFSKLWSKIKPIAEDVGKAGEVAGEAAA